uniref:Uncharacterized protein n=1 Tax=Equus caballus TaxID=9796 RepID=A0A3Q2HVD0_HORSE
MRVEETEKGSLTSNAAWGSSSIRASEKLRKNLPGKQRLQQGSLTKKSRGIKINSQEKKKHAAKPFVTRDVIRGYVFVSGSTASDCASSRDLYAGNHRRLGLAGSRSVFAEPREKEPFWFRCGCTVPLPRTTEAQAFSPVGFQVEKENLFRPKALKGVRWPEVVSVLLFFPT